MTQQKQFEAWAKSQLLDTDHKEKDAWGREQYSPHIHSMWHGWQAAQAQAITAQEVRSDIEIHLAHCFQPPYDTSCKYGDDECPATPKAAQAAAPKPKVSIELPQDDKREVKVWWTEWKDDVLQVSISVDQAAVEPVAWMHPTESYSVVTTHQKETNEFQYSDEFLDGHTLPLYTSPPDRSRS